MNKRELEEDLKMTSSGRKFFEEAEPCEMTTEEYRQRMMQAFQNANCDELISICVLPTEKEFEHLEWLLKNHYKKEPCEDAISRQAVLKEIPKLWNSNGDKDYCMETLRDFVTELPPVTPTCKKGKRIEQDSILNKIKAEIKEWYWQADKQALAKDPCVVDAMIDLFIRTIDKYKAEGEK